MADLSVTPSIDNSIRESGAPGSAIRTRVHRTGAPVPAPAGISSASSRQATPEERSGATASSDRQASIRRIIVALGLRAAGG